jgi:branched-chain amino acid aminotransferase
VLTRADHRVLSKEMIALLQREGCVSYGALKREFTLDDDHLEDLKAELIEAKRLAVDEDGKVLVWTGQERPASSGSGNTGRVPVLGNIMPTGADIIMDTPISITRTDRPKPKPRDTELGFGRLFTDHMFLMDCAADRGWHNPRVVPYGPLTLAPSAAVFHYSQEIFEGLKAYRSPRDTILLFRPDMNAARLNRSAARLCMPSVDEAFFLTVLKTLVSVERDWVPHAPGTSLYIRPTMIATEAFLGVRPSQTYCFFIILSPVGAYYAEGFNPVKILVEDQFVRAVKGGTGAAKTGGNYAASLAAGEEAHRKGFSQVLWLDGVERQYIEEVGSMNIAFVINGELVTPPLTGSILEGVTRDTVIQLAKDWGMRVIERPITITEVFTAAHNKRLSEIFGMGTAAVISPVSELSYKDWSVTINSGKVGPLAHRLFDEISAIQRGLKPDPHGWVVEVEA